jgi:hypothetical protein
MKRLRHYLVLATWLFIGLAVGGISAFAISQRINVLNEFPRTMNLRLIASESMASGAHKTTLQLLDMYENAVRRQMSSLGHSKFDWQHELIEIDLRRYIIYSNAKQTDLAEKAVVRAATLRKHRSPTDEEIEFERQLSKRLFLAKPE